MTSVSFGLLCLRMNLIGNLKWIHFAPVAIRRDREMKFYFCDGSKIAQFTKWKFLENEHDPRFRNISTFIIKTFRLKIHYQIRNNLKRNYQICLKNKLKVFVCRLLSEKRKIQLDSTFFHAAPCEFRAHLVNFFYPSFSILVGVYSYLT